MSNEDLKEYLSWSSPIGLGIFFLGVGILLWGLTAALQILTSL